MKKTLSICAIVFLCGCSWLQSFSDSVSPTYANKVAALEYTLAAAENIGTAYAKLERCGQNIKPLCKDPAIVAKMGVYDNVAYTAVKAARQTEDETKYQAALTAVEAFKAASSMLKTK